MSTESASVALERIDHGVLASNNLGRAFRFWKTSPCARNWSEWRRPRIMRILRLQYRQKDLR